SPLRAHPPIALHPPPRHVLAFLRVDPRVDPDTAGGRSVVFEGLEVGQQLAIRDGEAVHFFQNGFGRRLVRDPPTRIRTPGQVIPGEVQQTLVLRTRGTTIERLETPAEVIDQPQIRPGVTGWV